jgi:hypothetical protein
MVWWRMDGDAGSQENRPVPVGGRGMTAMPPDFAQVEAYWHALRAGDALPARSAIEPRALAPMLDRVMILERIAPAVARVRMAGSRLHDIMGMDLRGMPLTALIEPASRAAVAGAVERVFADPAAADLALEAERGIGRPALSARLMLLPLTGASGAVDRALAVLAVEGQVGRAPRRFALARALHRPVRSPSGWQAAPPSAARAPSHGEAAPGLAEPVAPWSPAPRPSPAMQAHPRAPWLRVVRNEE